MPELDTLQTIAVLAIGVISATATAAITVFAAGRKFERYSTEQRTHARITSDQLEDLHRMVRDQGLRNCAHHNLFFRALGSLGAPITAQDVQEAEREAGCSGARP